MDWKHVIGLVLLVGSVALFRIYLETKISSDEPIMAIQAFYTLAIMASTYLLEVK